MADGGAYERLLGCFGGDGGGFTKEVCCDTRYSAQGHPDCWDAVLTFEDCCRSDVAGFDAAAGQESVLLSEEDATGGEHGVWPPSFCENRTRLCRRALLKSWIDRTVHEQASLPALESGFGATAAAVGRAAWCTRRLAALGAMDVDAFEDGAEEATLERKRARSPYFRWLRRCAHLQTERLLGASLDLAEAGRVHRAASALTRADAPSVAVLLAVVGSARELYAEYEHWWRCYAERHGYSFVLDHSDYGHPVGYLKFLAASRQLDRFDWLVIVEPDVLPSPGCGMNVPLIEALSQSCCRGHCECEVVVSDQRPYGWAAAVGNANVEDQLGQETNPGFSMVRRSVAGRLFLDLILERRLWPGLPSQEQDAFGEAILEILSLELRAGSELYSIYRHECMWFMFALPPSLRNPELHSRQYSVVDYALCWNRAVGSLVGPAGDRGSAVVGFASPDVFNAKPFAVAWALPPGAWSGRPRGPPRRRPRGPWAANGSMLVLHFAAMGPAKLALMAWGLLAHYGVHPNASCSELVGHGRAP